MSTQPFNHVIDEPPKHFIFKICANLRNLWINTQPGTQFTQDNYLANYADDQKQNDANRV